MAGGRRPRKGAGRNVDAARRSARSSPEQRAAGQRQQAIPNAGPATADDRLRLGRSAAEDLAGRDPDELDGDLCRPDGRRHDPCARDVVAAPVAAAAGEPPRPWWAFIPKRKAREPAGRPD